MKTIYLLVTLAFALTAHASMRPYRIAHTTCEGLDSAGEKLILTADGNFTQKLEKEIVVQKRREGSSEAIGSATAVLHTVSVTKSESLQGCTNQRER